MAKLQQIPVAAASIAAMLCGQRSSGESGVCPQFIQIPLSKMSIEQSLKVSEKIIGELILPSRNKIGITFQVMKNRFMKNAFECIDIRMISCNQASTTDDEIIEDWKLIEQNLAMMKDEVTDSSAPRFLLTNKRQRKTNKDQQPMQQP